jgi:hypothetical protein
MATAKPKLSDKDKEDYVKLRIGETNTNMQGCLMKIIDYQNAMNITIQFQDEYKEIKNTRYERFKNGRIINSKLPNPKRKSKIGEEILNNQGCLMKIIGEYFCNSSKIKIEFQDKYNGIVIGEYGNFKKGMIENPNYRLYKIGETSTTTEGYTIKIINISEIKREYLVEFQDKYMAKKSVQYDTFLKGNVKNPYFKSVFGVGMTGEVSTIDKNKNTKISYRIWKLMLERCYDKKCLLKNPSYSSCSVCDEWLRYDNFEKWYDKNYYNCKGEKTHIDKDILYKDNKIYSPNTCIFVPSILNINFKNYNNNCIEKNGLYLVSIKSKIVNFNFKKYYLTENDAIFNKSIKRIELQELILNHYMNYIPSDVYNSILKAIQNRKESLISGTTI